MCIAQFSGTRVCLLPWQQTQTANIIIAILYLADIS
jgi:hypothetical protein